MEANRNSVLMRMKARVAEMHASVDGLDRCHRCREEDRDASDAAALGHKANADSAEESLQLLAIALRPACDAAEREVFGALGSSGDEFRAAIKDGRIRDAAYHLLSIEASVDLLLRQGEVAA